MLFQPFSIAKHNEHYEGGYTESALEWRRLGAIDKASNLQRMVGARSFDSVLEVGCGTGAVLAEVAMRGIGRIHTGVDLADPEAHRDPIADGLDLRIYDGQTLPFPDAHFDLVYASHVVEHVPNPRHFLAELARVARRAIYVEVPCELTARVSRRRTQAALDTGHINIYTPESFMILLQSSGLRVQDIDLFDHSLDVQCFGTTRAIGNTRRWVRSSLLRCSPLIASRLFCYHCGALVVTEIGTESGQLST